MVDLSFNLWIIALNMQQCRKLLVVEIVFFIESCIIVVVDFLATN